MQDTNNVVYYRKLRVWLVEVKGIYFELSPKSIVDWKQVDNPDDKTDPGQIFYVQHQKNELD